MVHSGVLFIFERWWSPKTSQGPAYPPPSPPFWWAWCRLQRFLGSNPINSGGGGNFPSPKFRLSKVFLFQNFVPKSATWICVYFSYNCVVLHKMNLWNFVNRLPALYGVSKLAAPLLQTCLIQSVVHGLQRHMHIIHCTILTLWRQSLFTLRYVQCIVIDKGIKL